MMNCWINCGEVVKGWMNGKWIMLFIPYYEILFSGIVHLCLLCLLEVYMKLYTYCENGLQGMMCDVK